MFRPALLPPLPTERAARAAAVEDRVAVVIGEINRLQAELVDLMAIVAAEGLAADDGLSPKAWLAHRGGMAPARAGAVVDVAARRGELPTVVEHLAAGTITVDQAAAVARHVPAPFEAQATELARQLPVSKVVHVLSRVGWEPSARAAAAHVEERAGVWTDDQGIAHVAATLAPDHGAVVATALRAARQDLAREAKATAAPGEAVTVTDADALVAIAECYLRHGQAAHPGTDRYRIHLHHEVGLDGAAVTTVHQGAALPTELARLHTCDGSVRSILEVGGRPVGICRAARIVPEWLRRIVEHRDGGCAFPGCTATRNLQIHHIVHFEDDGPTITANLLALCARHHRHHHLGLLGITGNPDLPAGTEGALQLTNRWGRPVAPNPIATGPPPPPSPPPPSPPSATTDTPAAVLPAYPPTSRERLDPWAVSFNPPPPPRPAPPNRYGEPLPAPDEGSTAVADRTGTARRPNDRGPRAGRRRPS